MREALSLKLTQLRDQLAGHDPTPVEKLLVDRVVLSWLQVHYLDLFVAQREMKLPLVEGEYWQRQRDRAHRRYLSSLRTLYLVRRLAVPALQVNVAVGQVCSPDIPRVPPVELVPGQDAKT